MDGRFTDDMRSASAQRLELTRTYPRPILVLDAPLSALDRAMEDAVVCALPGGCDTPCADGMFSQGEWQFLPIARDAADPAVLLPDEITADLDAETEVRVLEALRCASEGRTVLSISRRIYESLDGRTIEIKPQSG